MPKTASTILALLFTCSQVFGDSLDSVKSLEDYVSEESVQRVYRYNPLGLYASANPHSVYYLQDPTVAPSTPEATRLATVKEERTSSPSTHGFPKDSYGNRLQSPQSVAYTTVLPQHTLARFFVPLQGLPPRLAQPLLASTSTYQFPTSGSSTHAGPQNYYNYQASQSASAAPTPFSGRLQPYMYAENVRTFNPISIAPIQRTPSPFDHTISMANINALRQQSKNKFVYTNPQNSAKQEEKYQSLDQGIPKISPENLASETNEQGEERTQRNWYRPTTQTVTTFVNGKKTVLNLETRPTLPQLDLRLLEPLTFPKPVVPQMQHFLPKITMGTYKTLRHFKENESQSEDDEFHGIAPDKTHYETTDSGEVPDDELTPENADKEKEEELESNHSDEKHHADSEKKSPNYTETVKEQVVSYTKETQNDPQTFGYSKNIQNKPVEYTYQITQRPVHYTYIHDSNKPILLKEVNYEDEDNKPKELNDEKSTTPSLSRTIPTIAPHIHKHHTHHQSHITVPHHAEHKKTHHPHGILGLGGEISLTGNNVPQREQHHHQRKVHNQPNTELLQDSAHLRPEHKTEHQSAIDLAHKKKEHGEVYFQSHPIHSPIHPTLRHTAFSNDSVRPSNQQNISEYEELNHNTPDDVQHMVKYHSYNTEPTPHVRVIVQGETSDDKHSLHGKMMKEDESQEQTSEEAFEKDYKNSAYGFPAFNRDSSEEAKKFDPETYEVPNYNSDFKIENQLFLPYQRHNDQFPKFMRQTYKEANDKNKENYYLDYSINKPESVLDRYQKKLDYYKMFRKPKAGYFHNSADTNSKSKLSKNTVLPLFKSDLGKKKNSNKFSHYEGDNSDPYEFDYSKESPPALRASTTRTMLAQHKAQGSTQFVEPQFQFGFEPLALPQLLDSELAAMASNDAPGSEPLRKQLYRENYFIKKTSTSSAGKPDS